MRFSLLLVCMQTLLLGACGGGEGEPGAAGWGGAHALVTVSVEAQVMNCPTGGSKIETGIDADGNGLLGSSEVTDTQYVCNGIAGSADAGSSGANGSNGANGSSTGANGVSGANGGSGASGSNGANGTNAVNGSNAANALVNVVSEPAGANCTYGGSKVSTGFDDSANNVLDVGEVKSTTYVCDGGSLSWIDVRDAAVNAQSATGYIANSAQQVVVTLPANPAVGDVVRVSGAGTGGWKIAQNPGQAVYAMSLGAPAGAIWTALASTSGGWTFVASSADGQKLVAAGGVDRLIHVSSDGGASWRSTGTAQNWASLASSADGSKLVAISNQIYTSTDGGIKWVQRTSVPQDWGSVASSSDGMRLVALTTNSWISRSNDGGVNLSLVTIDDVASYLWRSVASSADGSRVVALTDDGIYTVSDVNGWVRHEAVRNWWDVASSADGNKLVAVVSGGQIYTSSDRGENWQPRESNRLWESVASSADGTRLVAVVYQGQIYTSSDSGVTWTAHESNRSWTSVASSADGTRLVAANVGGLIYTSVPTTSLGTDGSITGSQYDAITLQYVGNGMFNVLSHEGQLTAQ